MPTPQMRLELIDATELAETLTFISQWLARTDQAQLAASFGRFVGGDGYDLAALRDDLARFTFLLCHDDGESPLAQLDRHCTKRDQQDLWF